MAATPVSESIELEPTESSPDESSPDESCSEAPGPEELGPEELGPDEPRPADHLPSQPRPMAEFLATVGRRVRRQRALVHMSRRRLAERSGVSERYLAQLETGQGNMSIVLLRRVALALELPLPDLVAEEDADSVSKRIVIPL